MEIKELENIEKNIDIRANLIALKEKLKDSSTIDRIKEDFHYSPDILELLLMNSDPKIRKNAVLVMGLLKDKVFAEKIYLGYLKEETLFVKSSYLKALRNYDFSEYETSLRDRKYILEQGNFEEGDLKHVAEELRELKLMFPDEKMHTPHKFRNPEKPLSVFLTCKKEIVPSLLEDVKECLETVKGSPIFLGVAVKTKDIGRLSNIRTYKEMLFPINGMRAYAPGELIKELIGGDLFSILDNLHEPDTKEYNPFYFRISGNNINAQKLGMEIETASGGRLINSVSDYEIEIRIIGNKEGKQGGLIKLFTKADKRFAYRKKSVATSLHPVNAAAFIRLVEPYMARHAQIIDPFCGVGTVLIERNRSLRAKYIYGTDIFGEAIEGGKINADLARLTINFIHRDYFDFHHEYPFDEIITEMPKMEKELSDDFYRKFFDKSSEILANSGIIILLSQEMGLVKKYIRLHKEFILIKEILFNSKEEQNIYVISKNRE